MGAQRYFPHSLDDSQDPTEETLTSALLHAARTVLQSQASPHALQGPNPYVGAAGLACACSEAARALGPVSVRPDVQLTSQLEQLAADQCRLALASASDFATLSPHASALLDGTAGMYCVAALMLAGQATQPPPLPSPVGPTPDACVASYLALLPQALRSKSDEVLYGRAGYLLGLLLLQDRLPPSAVTTGPLADAVRDVSMAILSDGRATASQVPWHASASSSSRSPLLYAWHGKPYLGAAHGLVGILHALLSCPDAAQQYDTRATDDIQGALSYVLAHERDVPGRPGQGGHYPSHMEVGFAEPEDEGRSVLVHWCHGAPGVAMLMAQAHEVFSGTSSSSPYLEAAVRAGDLVWERGLLRKGPGLCHGISGNAYALLAVWRASGDPRWLRRARHFGAFLATPEGQSTFGTPDHPASLFEGLGGALPLLAQLLSGVPEAARMPLYEI